MKQSSFIFGAILIAFLVFITVRNQLPEYLALFSSTKKVVEPVKEKAKPESKIEDLANSTIYKAINDVFSQAGFA